ncbi:MAG: DNA recombination protein RmuC [Chloroflexi bacterium]|nr:DNA recombination protein RmuC [Chloroflexota bacterium]MCL5273297.1 DNA recombination protein RmuC [Chloroflexota bacterium]
MDAFLVIVVIFLVLALLVVLFFQLRKPVGSLGDVSTALQNLTQSLQQGQTQIATLAEKVAHLEPVAQTVNSVEVELRGLTERVSGVEQKQMAANQGISSLATGLAQTEATISSRVGNVQQQSADSLYRVSNDLAGRLGQIQKELAEMQSNAKARRDIEQLTADSIRRLEAVIAGTQSKGSAGENILEIVFAKLPIEWQVRNFSVGGKPVEFGLRLPNNLILPIDSKWAATGLLEQFMAASDPADQQRLKGEIEKAVIHKAREVKKYIDPSVTVAFGVAVVPDAIYDLSAGIQTEAFQLNVVLVSYSMFVPYLLLVFQMVLKTSQSIDLQKLDAYIQTAQASIKALQDELDGRFSRAITMLGNSRDDMRAHMSKAGSSLTSLQISTSASAAELPAQ